MKTDTLSTVRDPGMVSFLSTLNSCLLIWLSVPLLLELRDPYHKLRCGRNYGMITGGMTPTARAAD